MPCSAGASTGGQTLSTPRSNQPEEVKPTPQPFLQCPDTPPFPNLSTPFYTHNTTPITYISHPQHSAQLSSPYTTPFFIPPPCGGLMPGPQWVLCGACHAWGTIVVSQTRSRSCMKPACFLESLTVIYSILTYFCRLINVSRRTNPYLEIYTNIWRHTQIYDYQNIYTNKRSVKGKL